MSHASPGRNTDIVELVGKVAGGWPTEVDQNKVLAHLDRLLPIVNRYQTMPHPGYPGQVSPDYVYVDGRLARRGQPMEDSKLVNTSSFLIRKHGRISLTIFDQRLSDLAYEVIQEYGGRRLAKALFFLPRAVNMSCAEKTAIIIEDWAADVYRGVENVLFEIYEDLKDGEMFDDGHVTRKLLSIFRRSWQ